TSAQRLRRRSGAVPVARALTRRASRRPRDDQEGLGKAWTHIRIRREATALPGAAQYRYGRRMKIKGEGVLFWSHFATISAIGSVAESSRRAADRLLWPRIGRMLHRRARSAGFPPARGRRRRAGGVLSKRASCRLVCVG